MAESAPFTVTDEYVYRVAPDGKSAQAGQELVRRGAFSKAKMSEDGTRLEALCQGSEPKPYAVRVDLSKPARPETGCPCFSMKRPCKHAVGLLFLAAHSPEAFEGSTRKPSRAAEMTATTARQEPKKKKKRPSDTGEALLQAVLADPEDDAPRLIYADWLDEFGEAKDRDRAEFIRLQMELARLAKGGPRPRQLLEREKELWKAHREEWAPGLPPALTKSVLFHNGFLEELPANGRLRRVDLVKLFANHPIYRVRLSGGVDRHLTGDLAVIPQLAKVRVLRLEGCAFDEPMKTLQILFATPFLSGVRRLEMTGSHVSTRELGVLVASPLLARLQELDLSDNAIGPGGVQQLAASPDAAGLRKLSLANNPVGAAGAKALAASPHLEKLEELDLRRVDLGATVQDALRERFGGRVLLG